MLMTKERDINDLGVEEGEDAVRRFSDTGRVFTPEEASQPKPRKGDRGAAVNGKDARPPRFKLVRFRELLLGTAATYLVKGIIPRTGIVVVWGPPKCGKSFWTFDLTMHLALNWQYREYRTRGGPVVYCAFEGADGFKARAEAFRRAHGIEPDADVPFFLSPMRMNLVKDHPALIISIKAQIGDVVPVAVVLDTLNRSIVGSESSDEDMTAYLNAADAIREAFGCVVIIVHHCGVDGSRPRGHTSLTGAADAQLSVIRDAAGNILVRVEWLKDGAEGATIVSKLELLEIGLDDDGDAITSCVVRPVEDAEATRVTDKSTKRMPKPARTALRALREAIDECGEPAPASNHIPASIKVTTIERWRDYAYRRGISTGELRAKQKAFKVASEHLNSSGEIGIWGEHVWPVHS
jgi:hypothetical protein